MNSTPQCKLGQENINNIPTHTQHKFCQTLLFIQMLRSSPPFSTCLLGRYIQCLWDKWFPIKLTEKPNRQIFGKISQLMSWTNQTQLLIDRFLSFDGKVASLYIFNLHVPVCPENTPSQIYGWLSLPILETWIKRWWWWWISIANWWNTKGCKWITGISEYLLKNQVTTRINTGEAKSDSSSKFRACHTHKHTKRGWERTTGCVLH